MKWKHQLSLPKFLPLCTPSRHTHTQTEQAHTYLKDFLTSNFDSFSRLLSTWVGYRDILTFPATRPNLNGTNILSTLGGQEQYINSISIGTWLEMSNKKLKKTFFRGKMDKQVDSISIWLIRNIGNEPNYFWPQYTDKITCKLNQGYYFMWFNTLTPPPPSPNRWFKF